MLNKLSKLFRKGNEQEKITCLEDMLNLGLFNSNLEKHSIRISVDNLIRNIHYMFIEIEKPLNENGRLDNETKEIIMKKINDIQNECISLKELISEIDNKVSNEIADYENKINRILEILNNNE